MSLLELGPEKRRTFSGQDRRVSIRSGLLQHWLVLAAPKKWHLQSIGGLKRSDGMLSVGGVRFNRAPPLSGIPTGDAEVPANHLPFSASHGSARCGQPGAGPLRCAELLRCWPASLMWTCRSMLGAARRRMLARAQHCGTASQDPGPLSDLQKQNPRTPQLEAQSSKLLPGSASLQARAIPQQGARRERR